MPRKASRPAQASQPASAVLAAMPHVAGKLPGIAELPGSSKTGAGNIFAQHSRSQLRGVPLLTSRLTRLPRNTSIYFGAKP